MKEFYTVLDCPSFLFKAFLLEGLFLQYWPTESPIGQACQPIWEFPKIRGTSYGGPYDEDPTIWGAVLWSPIFGNPHLP